MRYRFPSGVCLFSVPVILTPLFPSTSSSRTSLSLPLHPLRSVSCSSPQFLYRRSISPPICTTLIPFLPFAKTALLLPPTPLTTVLYIVLYARHCSFRPHTPPHITLTPHLRLPPSLSPSFKIGPLILPHRRSEAATRWQLLGEIIGIIILSSLSLPPPVILVSPSVLYHTSVSLPPCSLPP